MSGPACHDCDCANFRSLSRHVQQQTTYRMKSQHREVQVIHVMYVMKHLLKRNACGAYLHGPNDDLCFLILMS